MPVTLGEHLLAARAGFGGDVLERLHLLGDKPASLLDHSHAGHRRLDGQRSEDPGEERNDERGAEPEEKGHGWICIVDLLLLICRGCYQPGSGAIVTFRLRRMQSVAAAEKIHTSYRRSV